MGHRICQLGSTANSAFSGQIGCHGYSTVPNIRARWNKQVGGNFSRNLINKLDGIKELVGICTKAKNELVRKFSNFITLKIENHFNSKITLTVHQLLEIELIYRKLITFSKIIY